MFKNVFSRWNLGQLIREMIHWEMNHKTRPSKSPGAHHFIILFPDYHGEILVCPLYFKMKPFGDVNRCDLMLDTETLESLKLRLRYPLLSYNG